MARNLFLVSELLTNKTSEYNTIIWDYCNSFINQYALFNLPENFDTTKYDAWIWALLGSAVVGLSGIFPLLIIPLDDAVTLKDGPGGKMLRILLSFAVGGLLGDVFLHLLPEAWENPYASPVGLTNVKNGHPSLVCGLWVLTGLLTFIIIEKIFSFEKEKDASSFTSSSADTASKSMPMSRKRSSFILNDLTCCQRDKVCYKELFLLNSTSSSRTNDLATAENNIIGKDKGIRERRVIRFTKDKKANEVSLQRKQQQPQQKSENKSATNNKGPGSIQISGYLNLVANSIDNFSHGLSIGGSFLLSMRVGLFTTFAILVHEIPHEVGDFAILLRAGFSRWDAAWAQIGTASAVLFGSSIVLLFSGSSDAVEARTSWILPFTAGGFLHMSLVTLLPELLEEKNPKESFKQMCSLAGGITVMAVLTALVEH